MVGLLKNLPFPFCIVLDSLFGITTLHYIIFSDTLRELPFWYNNLKISLNQQYRLGIGMGKKAIIEIHLVSESKDVDNKRIEKEIKESLQCDWLAEIEKVTVKNEP